MGGSLDLAAVGDKQGWGVAHMNPPAKALVELGGHTSLGACGAEASRRGGGWEVRFGMPWGPGVGLDSQGGGWPPGPWSPGGRRGTGAATFPSVSRTGHDSRVEALGPRGGVSSPAIGGKERAWLSGSDG